MKSALFFIHLRLIQVIWCHGHWSRMTFAHNVRLDSNLKEYRHASSFFHDQKLWIKVERFCTGVIAFCLFIQISSNKMHYKASKHIIDIDCFAFHLLNVLNFQFAIVAVFFPVFARTKEARKNFALFIECFNGFHFNICIAIKLIMKRMNENRKSQNYLKAYREVWSTKIYPERQEASGKAAVERERQGERETQTQTRTK